MQEKNEQLVTFSESLVRAMGKVNGKALAEGTGLTPTAISYYVNGKRMPGAAELRSIARFLNVTMEELLDGKPPSALVPKHHGGPYWGTTNLVPIISWARAGAGHGYEDQGDAGEKIPTTCQDPNCYALEIEGDSMAPVYLPKDIVVVMPNREARNGDLIIARTLDDEETLFKRLKFSGDGQTAKLESFNPHHPLIQLPKGGLRFLHPVHSVVRILRR